MGLITFADLLKLAEKENVHLDKVSVGIWAKQKGYIKKRIQKNKVVTIYYFKPEDKELTIKN